KDYDNAILHAQKGLSFAEKTGQDYAKAGLLDALGGLYLAKNQLDSCIFYYQKALEIRQRSKDLQGIGLSYNNLAKVENKRKNKQAALNYYKLAHEVFEKINNKYYIASSYANIAELLLDMGKHQEAKPYTLKCLEISRAIGNIPFQQSSYEQLVRIDSINQDFLSAFRHYKQYSLLKDSVNDAQRSKQIAEMLTKYDTEKKDAENKLLRKEVDLRSAVLQRTYAIGAGVAGVAVLLMILAVVLYKSNKQKQLTNKLLERQKEEIMLQNIELKQQKEEIQAQQEFIELKNAELATKNELIQSSIQAALNIQKSVLPKESLMNEILGEHLLLYLPRDIVSGDFYWVDSVKGRKIAAVFDCTGHGVPGAFMSLIGMTMLDRVIEHAKTEDPAEYLNRLEAEIYEQMNQDISRNEYGMDASIVSWKITEQGDIDLLYVGAKRPLYLFTPEGEFLTLKGNKKSVAQSMEKMATQPFMSERISLKTGCVFYICSDGFIDQNNEKRHRFSEKSFIQMLQGMYRERFEKQKEIAFSTLQNFMGNEPQRDDIVLMGVKI
ncbi:MAG: SpoIIE family protein phosphatase, partial [Flammeovirgaceae bacterium]|nr:SpoIIE family protein phosphatase [Flammeovirgaceae bacterium]MDW8287586.1 SpoIIE family protein phosphatase [Flammeovirgaceae bacterium]